MSESTQFYSVTHQFYSHSSGMTHNTPILKVYFFSNNHHYYNDEQKHAVTQTIKDNKHTTSPQGKQFQ